MFLDPTFGHKSQMEISGTLFRSEEARLTAFSVRDAAADSAFIVAVTSTRIYCRPTCPARQPKPQNIRFYDTPAAAEAAGFRACLRCRPTGISTKDTQLETIRRACKLIEGAETAPNLKALAKTAGYSPYYFQRLFKTLVGVSPKEYAAQKRTLKFRDELRENSTVTAAIYQAGFQSSSRAYEVAERHLGMTPGAAKRGGVGEIIHYAAASCSLGYVGAGATARGICYIGLRDDAAGIKLELQRVFPRAELIEDNGGLAEFLPAIVRFIEMPKLGLELPLDIQGTAFQRRVWQALQDIPLGATSSYSEVAEAIGVPRAARAVAKACADNKIALIIPCHRVLHRDGTISGYRGGVHRKRALLDREGA